MTLRQVPRDNHPATMSLPIYDALGSVFTRLRAPPNRRATYQGSAMEFSLSEEQQLLKDSIARFVEREYGFDKRQKLVAESGGLGGSPVDTAIVMEEFGKALVLEPYLHIAILAARVLNDAGADATLIEAIGSGDAKPVLAHSEADAYGVLNWVQTRAERAGDLWLLTGQKSLVHAAPFATHFIVSARTSGDAGDADGISLFLVAPEASGLTRKDARLADNSRASELTLTNCEATPIGVGGTALPTLATADAHATVAICAEALGAMDKALWTTRDYLQTREQFGVAIGTFQSLQHRMADMLIELEMARSQVYRGLAYLNAAPDERDRAISSMKVQIGRSVKFIAAQSVQLHGGMGMTEEYLIGHYFRRLFMIESAFGSSGVHLDRMASIEKKAA
jgi:alkylation response protein AidB-like acyl-CoA dehydrogenase